MERVRRGEDEGCLAFRMDGGVADVMEEDGDSGEAPEAVEFRDMDEPREDCCGAFAALAKPSMRIFRVANQV